MHKTHSCQNKITQIQINICSELLKPLNSTPFLSPCIFAPESRANKFHPALASPNSVLSIKVSAAKTGCWGWRKRMIILMFHPVSFGLGTVSVESLDCELSENIYFYECQMFIIKSILRQNKIDAFLCIFWCETFFSDQFVTCG